MGLAAVCFGAAYRTWHLPLPLAALCRAAGRLRRRRAERAADRAARASGADRDARHVLAVPRRRRRDDASGAVNYTGFPSGFLFLGQGYLGGVDPGAVADLRRDRRRRMSCCCIARCRPRVVRDRVHSRRARATPRSRSHGASASSTCCRGWWRASRRSSTSRISGRPDRTRAPATSSTRSRPWSSAARRCSADAARSGGTLLGLFALAVLQTGLHLAAWPSELTGVLTGVLLLATIAADRHIRRHARVRAADRRGARGEEQSGCGALRHDPRRLAHRRRHQRLARSLGVSTGARPPDGRAAPAATPRRTVIAMMPKAKGDPYFVSCRAGAEEAARELDVELDLGRPDQPRRRQAERAGRELDHAQGGRDRGRGREPGRHLHGAAQGARARHPGR